MSRAYLTGKTKLCPITRSFHLKTINQNALRCLMIIQCLLTFIYIDIYKKKGQIPQIHFIKIKEIAQKFKVHSM